MIRTGMAKKRNLIVAGILALTIVATGCGAKAPATEKASAPEAKTSVEKTATEEEKEAKPAAKVDWKKCTEEEAKALVPNALVLPEGFELVSWYTLEDGSQEGGLANVPMVRMEVQKDGWLYDARAQVTGDEYLNLVGADKPEWIQENDDRLVAWGDDEAEAKSYVADVGDGFSLSLITWHDKESGISYSLHSLAKIDGGVSLGPVAEQFSPHYAVLTGKAPAESETSDNTTDETASAQGNTDNSDLFYVDDINTLISTLVQEMGLEEVEADDIEKGKFIGGGFIGKYGYKADSNGHYQNYYTFYDLGDCMATNVTFMGWDGINYYDYGTYTFDTVKQSLIDQAE